jgi:histidinol-phosphate aminotransferase
MYAFHGGKSFEAIGENLQTLERSATVINADVLDAWFDPSPRVLDKLERFLPFLVRSSPPVRAAGLVEAIAHARGVPEACVLAAGGSSDLIFSCLPQLVNARQRATILDPMYGEYRHVLEQVIGSDLTPFPLEESGNFGIETEALIRHVRKTQPDLVVIVNPNNPTGRHWPRQEVVRFLNALPHRTLVMIDETYIEYAGQEESVEREACVRNNLVVLKSMSKVYALSGMRVGYLVARRDLVERLARHMRPWSVSLPAQVAAVEALCDPAYYQQRYCETHELRNALVAGLCRIQGVQVYPSSANFVLLRVPGSAQRILERMCESDVYVRNCDSMSNGFGNRFLRIAVKTSAGNERITEALAGAIGRVGPQQFQARPSTLAPL